MARPVTKFNRAYSLDPAYSDPIKKTRDVCAGCVVFVSPLKEPQLSSTWSGSQIEKFQRQCTNASVVVWFTRPRGFRLVLMNASAPPCRLFSPPCYNHSPRFDAICRPWIFAKIHKSKKLDFNYEPDRVFSYFRSYVIKNLASVSNCNCFCRRFVCKAWACND